MNTPGRRALFDNLARNEALALAVDGAVRTSRQDDWRSNPFKVKKVRNAIKSALNDDEDAAARMLELVKNQHEY